MLVSPPRGAFYAKHILLIISKKFVNKFGLLNNNDITLNKPSEPFEGTSVKKTTKLT